MTTSLESTNLLGGDDGVLVNFADASASDDGYFEKNDASPQESLYIVMTKTFMWIYKLRNIIVTYFLVAGLVAMVGMGLDAILTLFFALVLPATLGQADSFLLTVALIADMLPFVTLVATLITHSVGLFFDLWFDTRWVKIKTFSVTEIGLKHFLSNSIRPTQLDRVHLASTNAGVSRRWALFANGMLVLLLEISPFAAGCIAVATSGTRDVLAWVIFTGAVGACVVICAWYLLDLVRQWMVKFRSLPDLWHRGVFWPYINEIVDSEEALKETTTLQDEKYLRRRDPVTHAIAKGGTQAYAACFSQICRHPQVVLAAVTAVVILGIIIAASAYEDGYAMLYFVLVVVAVFVISMVVKLAGRARRHEIKKHVCDAQHHLAVTMTKEKAVHVEMQAARAKLRLAMATCECHAANDHQIIRASLGQILFSQEWAGHTASYFEAFWGVSPAILPTAIVLAIFATVCSVGFFATKHPISAIPLTILAVVLFFISYMIQFSFLLHRLWLVVFSLMTVFFVLGAVANFVIFGWFMTLVFVVLMILIQCFLPTRSDLIKKPSFKIAAGILLVLATSIMILGVVVQSGESGQLSVLGSHFNGSDFKYEVCRHSWADLDIMDFAFLSNMAYLDASDVQSALDVWFKGRNFTQKLIANKTVQFYEFANEQTGVSVVAIRGTATSKDMVQDADLYLDIGMLQAVSLVTGFVDMWSEDQVIRWVDFFGTIGQSATSQSSRRYYEPVVDYVNELKARHKTVLLTGHSLGGSIAKICGARTKSTAVVFSGPGIVWSSKKFDVDVLDIFEFVVNIVPARDLVPKVDKLGGSIQFVECDSSYLGCHSLARTTCELLNSCGDKYDRDILDSKGLTCKENRERGTT